MENKSIAFVWVLALCLPSSAAFAQGRAEDGRQIVLLGARWCAPCMAEWRDLHRSVAAVAPERLVLGWIDGAIPVPPDLIGQVGVMPPAQALTLARGALGEGFGLPAAVMIGGAGRVCAVWRGVLRPEGLMALREGCEVRPRRAE